MKIKNRIINVIDSAFDKLSYILLPIFFIGVLILGIYHELTREKPLNQALYGIINNIRENIIIIIISIVLGTFLSLLFMKIKRNKNNIFFPKMGVLFIFLAATIWMTLIIIRSSPLWTLFLPFIFLLIIIQGLTEYYKISGEVLSVKKGIMNKTELINIKEITSIGRWTESSGEGSETFIIIYYSNKIIKLREKIENRNVFIKKILEINKNISISVYEKVNFSKNKVVYGEYIYDDLLNEKEDKIFVKIIFAMILIIFYSIDFYILIMMIINK